MILNCSVQQICQKCRSYMKEDIMFYIFSSPEPKIQRSISDHPLPVCTCMSFCKLFTFLTFSNTTGPILIKLGIKHPLGKGVSKPFSKWDNCETVSISCLCLKIIFSKTTALEIKLFTQKLVYIVKILYCKIRDPGLKLGPPAGLKFQHRNA